MNQRPIDWGSPCGSTKAESAFEEPNGFPKTPVKVSAAEYFHNPGKSPWEVWWRLLLWFIYLFFVFIPLPFPTRSDRPGRPCTFVYVMFPKTVEHFAFIIVDICSSWRDLDLIRSRRWLALNCVAMATISVTWPVEAIFQKPFKIFFFFFHMTRIYSSCYRKGGGGAWSIGSLLHFLYFIVIGWC